MKRRKNCPMRCSDFLKGVNTQCPMQHMCALPKPISVIVPMT